MTGLRLACAHAAGTVAGRLSAALGRGRGEALHGRVLLALHPGGLAELAAGRDIVLVSGTNGKTTTTSFLAHRLAAASGEGVSTSRYGANLATGIAAVLAQQPRHRLAVLECDELFLPEVAGAVHPRAIVLLNLSRDQLHRTGEVRKVAFRWHEALRGSTATVVIDRDDPFLEYAAATAGTVVRVSFGGRRHPDGGACPSCGTVLDWSGGDYRCRCGLGSLPVDVRGPAGLTGPQRNAVLALTAVRAMGFDIPEQDEMQAIAQAPDRVTTHRVAGRLVTTRLAKNPESWRSALTAVQSDTVVLAVNARGIDGRDTSWLWDVDYRPLSGRRVICTGDRRLDVAYRLHVQGIAVEVADTVEAAVAGVSDQVEAIASYTAYQDLAGQAAGIRARSGGRP